MIYSVSFLNNKAQPDKKLWITTDAMNSVITHTKKKIKFVYVETIFNKPGWVPLQKGDCCAVGVSNDGAVGFCNDGNNGSSDSDDGSDDEKVDHAANRRHQSASLGSRLLTSQMRYMVKRGCQNEPLQLKAKATPMPR